MIIQLRVKCFRKFLWLHWHSGLLSHKFVILHVCKQNPSLTNLNLYCFSLHDCMFSKQNWVQENTVLVRKRLPSAKNNICSSRFKQFGSFSTKLSFCMLASRSQFQQTLNCFVSLDRMERLISKQRLGPRITVLVRKGYHQLKIKLYPVAVWPRFPQNFHFACRQADCFSWDHGNSKQSWVLEILFWFNKGYLQLKIILYLVAVWPCFPQSFDFVCRQANRSLWQYFSYFVILDMMEC